MLIKFNQLIKDDKNAILYNLTKNPKISHTYCI